MLLLLKSLDSETKPVVKQAMPEHVNERQLIKREAGSENAALTSLDIIRTETILSKLPVHNLAKKGSINIVITRKNEKGETTLHWEVTPDPKYGEPRALAYKLETIHINRSIEDASNALEAVPEVVRIGSLTELAADMGLGNDTGAVKKALRQNAFTRIKAHIIFTDKHGRELEKEFEDSRYGLRFYGQRLPDGRKADAVYIVLHKDYRDILDSAPRRPLDRQYMKELPPAPQRWYEIASYKVFAALKYHRTAARLLYSEYCLSSATHRYYDYNHFKKQMYKVHKPHVDSGYITRARYEATTDAVGQADWIMYYIIGPKARREYETYNPTKKVIEADSKTIEAQITPADPEPKQTRVGKRGAGETPSLFSEPVAADPDPTPADPKEGIDLALLTELTKRGIHEPSARDLIKNKAPGQYVMDQLEYGDFLIAQAAPGKFTNPPGFYIYLIRENVPITDPRFESTRQKHLREEAAQIERRKDAERARLRLAHEKYRTEALDAFITEHYTPEQLQDLAQAKKREIKTQNPDMYKGFQFWSQSGLNDFLANRVRADIARQLDLPTFEQFCQQQNQQQQPAPIQPQAATAQALTAAGEGTTAEDTPASFPAASLEASPMTPPAPDPKPEPAPPTNSPVSGATDESSLAPTVSTPIAPKLL
jgi:hypothetical protein